MEYGFFRDYGLYDHTMLRFNPANKLSENFYVRQDGTRAYYFSKGELDQLVVLAVLPLTKTASSLYFSYTLYSSIPDNKFWQKGKKNTQSHTMKADERRC